MPDTTTQERELRDVHLASGDRPVLCYFVDPSNPVQVEEACHTMKKSFAENCQKTQDPCTRTYSKSSCLGARKAPLPY